LKEGKMVQRLNLDVLLGVFLYFGFAWAELQEDCQQYPLEEWGSLMDLLHWIPFINKFLTH